MEFLSNKNFKPYCQRVVYKSQRKVREFIIKGIRFSNSIHTLSYLEYKFNDSARGTTTHIKSVIPKKPIINFIYYHGVHNKRDISFLKQVLKAKLCKRLTRLKFILSDSYIVHDSDLEFICLTLRQCLNLQDLRLSLLSLYSVTGRGLSPLRATFQSLKSLKHLMLQFAICHKIDDYGQSCLLDSFSGLRQSKIQSIYLNIGKIYADLSEFLPCFTKMMSCLNLSCLGLNLLSNNIEENNFIEALNHLSSLENLQYFNFTTIRPFSHTEKISFFNALSKMERLRKLSLKLQALSIDSFKALIENISTLIHLEDFKLCLHRNQGLNLSAPESNYHEELLQEISLFIKSHSKILKSFSLNLCWNSDNSKLLFPQSSDSEGLTEIGTQISSCRRLQYLCLFGMPMFRNTALQHFLESISLLSSLRTLSLQLTADRALEFEALNLMKQLCHMLSNNKQIQKLSLCLLNFEAYDQRNVNILGQTITKLQSLRKFTCEFKDCNMAFDENTRDYLVERILNNKNIEKAELAFIGKKLKNKSQSLDFVLDDKGKKISVYSSEIPFCLSKVCSFDIFS